MVTLSMSDWSGPDVAKIPNMIISKNFHFNINYYVK